MQITLNLDESLLKEAFQLTNLTTQEELMNLALQEFVKSRRKKNLLAAILILKSNKWYRQKQSFKQATKCAPASATASQRS